MPGYLKNPHVAKHSSMSVEALYERSRESSYTLRKFLLVFAVGMLSFVFLSMLGEHSYGTNSLKYKIILILSLGCFFIACMAGIAAIYCDAKYNFYWAKLKESEDKKMGKLLMRRHLQYKSGRRFFDWLLRYTFVLGILIFAVLAVLLIWQK